MSEVPIVGQKKIEPKCPHCQAQPLNFLDYPVANQQTGKVFICFICSNCQNTISIQFVAQLGGIVPPNTTLKFPGSPQ